jgi:hypothetical protein
MFSMSIINSEKLYHMKEKIMNNTSRTDWAKIDAMSDDEIDTSDIPPLADDFFLNAKLRMPYSSLATVAIRVDPETLLWFQSKGEEAEQHNGCCLTNLCRSAEKCCWDASISLTIQMQRSVSTCWY